MKILYIISFLICQLSYTQEVTVSKEKNFWGKVWGRSPDNGIKFLPFATHFQKTENPFIHGAFYTAANYKSIELSVFNNSYNDFSMALFYLREITIYKKLKLLYGGGFLYGYKGKLQKVGAIPLNNTFLYSGNLNPTYGIALEYRMSKKWGISAMTNPAVIIYGVKYYL